MDKNKIFISQDKLVEQDNVSIKKLVCSICKGIVLEPVELFCDHIFCSNCLKDWSEKLNDRCPLCNKVIYKKPSISEENKIILLNLKFYDNGKEYTYNEYIKFLTFGTNINFDEFFKLYY